MAASDGLNNSSDINFTLSRKRKRHLNKLELDQYDIDVTSAVNSCFTNAAFCSTPKKVLAKRRIQLRKHNENDSIFPNTDHEVTSNVKVDKHEKAQQVRTNPYEVLRKPPKKKRRQIEETACFENPALNLELPEKILNPYEVVREVALNKGSNCFTNPALNLKVQDTSLLCNPFEVQRAVEATSQPMLLHPFVASQEADNPNHELTQKPCQFKLGLPFVPKVGCRIDFKDISMSQLSPSVLLAERLVLSPVQNKKLSLDSIGEETTMDIGKELDQYQLELENSINEAKLRKRGINKDISFSPKDVSYQMYVENKSKFTQKLNGIEEDKENEQKNEEFKQEHVECTKVNVKKEPNAQCPETEAHNNIDELYDYFADDPKDDDSINFTKPSPFVRAYTKTEMPVVKLKESRDYLESVVPEKIQGADDYKKPTNVKNIIRKSIRKLMHLNQEDEPQKTKNENQVQKNNGLINTIRQSLRRKTARDLNEKTEIKDNEISIIDGTERTMKLKSDILQTEFVKIEDLTNEKKHSLRHSLRKSTREVRNHFLKPIFYKTREVYDLNQ